MAGMRVEEIDDSTQAAILRLTESERECLKRCLLHQTAKQMALDLGISPHAVEKRLKMARAKLGLSSSLEAAKLVELSDRYGRTGPHSSVLSSVDASRDENGSVAAPRSETAWSTRHRAFLVSGAIIMSASAALVLIIGLQSSGALDGQTNPPTAATEQTAALTSVPNPGTPSPGTEAAIRSLVAGLKSGSPEYEKLSPQFAAVVRQDLAMTHEIFRTLGDLQSMTFRGRGERGDDVYNLTFAHGDVIMSAALDADGRMVGGLLNMAGPRRPAADPGTGPTAGTEAALRTLVAGLASGAPEYEKISPQFAEIIRRDLPMTHAMFTRLGELQSVTFIERRAGGDDAYNLKFANGEVIMSASLDGEGRMAGGILQPQGPPRP